MQALLPLLAHLTHRKVILIGLIIATLLTGTGAAAYIHSVQQNNAKKEAEILTAASEKAKNNGKSSTSTQTPSSGEANSDKSTSSANPDAQTPGAPSTTNSPSTAPSTTKNSSGSTSSPSTGGTTTPSTPSTPSTPKCPTGYSGTYPNCVAPPPSPVGLSGNWRLIMQDEFSGSSLNTAMWTPQRGPSYSYGDPYNPQYEDAYYLANNPKVQNGSLVLTLNQGSTNGYPYSSGMVQNGRNFNYKYGYTEARIKVPGNTGVWPAYWTLSAPVDQSWPPEIDIFEFGLSSQTRPSFNYHYGSSSNHQQSGLTLYGSSSVNYTQDYHVYGMLWTSTKIQVYIDGVPGPSYTNSANITSLPQYLILNLGLKKGASVPSGTAMYVDYVRVWQ